MAGLIGLLILSVILLIIALGMWIGIAKLSYQKRKDIGLGIIGIHFLLAWGAVALAYFLLVSNEPCSGFLCELDDLLYFYFVGAGILVLWPSLLLIHYRVKYGEKDEKGRWK